MPRDTLDPLLLPMTTVDLALLTALAVTGGAFVVAAGLLDWRDRALERRFWGDPDLGRHPLAHGPPVPSAPSADVVVPLVDRIRMAETRAAEARRALDALRREADRQRRAGRLSR